MRFTLYILQIVWDPEKKKWVNTEQDSTDEQSFRPPPKMGGLPNTANNINNNGINNNNIVTAPNIPNANTVLQNSQEPQSVKTKLAFNAIPAIDTNNLEPKPPATQSNMFKMQKNKCKRNQHFLIKHIVFKYNHNDIFYIFLNQH